MLLTKYFLPILKETPKDAQISSHRLMLRSGMIKQDSAGIYSWLPLGKKVLTAIAKIVKEEQDKTGAHEILMPTIQSSNDIFEVISTPRSLKIVATISTAASSTAL